MNAPLVEAMHELEVLLSRTQAAHRRVADLLRQPSPGGAKTATPYLKWVGTLIEGDRLRVCSPWDDGQTPGGHISRGRVVSRRMGGVYVTWMNRRGARQSEFFHFASGASGPYGYLLPLGRDVQYDPKHGMVFKRR